MTDNDNNSEYVTIIIVTITIIMIIIVITCNNNNDNIIPQFCVISACNVCQAAKYATGWVCSMQRITQVWIQKIRISHSIAGTEVLRSSWICTILAKRA